MGLISDGKNIPFSLIFKEWKTIMAIWTLKLPVLKMVLSALQMDIKIAGIDAKILKSISTSKGRKNDYFRTHACDNSNLS